MTRAPDRRRPVPLGASSDITRRQDEPDQLRRLCAYSYLYRVGQRWRRARAIGTLALAAAAPLFAFAVPAAADVLGAVAAGWLVVGRTLLSWGEQRVNEQAVKTQESYDTRLFHLPWNTSLAGREPSADDIAAAARHIKDAAPYKNWYSIDLGDTPWPADALLCQRQSIVWGRYDHTVYGTLVAIAGTAVLVVGLVTALTLDLSLRDYLVQIFLPTAPALLGTAELARAHYRHAASRKDVEHDIHDMWDRYRSDPAALPPSACRRIQDAAFTIRRTTPRVPNLVYKVRRNVAATATETGTQVLIESADDGARSTRRSVPHGPVGSNNGSNAPDAPAPTDDPPPAADL